MGRPPDPADEVRRLHERLEELQRLLGRMEGQRELQAVAESTLRESPDRERQRADAYQLEANQLGARSRRPVCPGGGDGLGSGLQRKGFSGSWKR